MSCSLVLFVVVQILFHSSRLALVVDLGVGLGCWLRLFGLLFASLAFSFPSIPWCDGIQVIIICLWSLVSSVCMFPKPFV